LTEDETQVVEQTDQSVQATDQAAESDEQHAERQQPQEQEASKRKDAEYNWNEARRRMAELERIARDQQQTIERLSKSQAPDDDDLSSLSGDDILTVAQARKLNDYRAKQAHFELQRQKDEILKLKYPDIDQVLSQENIAYFEQNEPELAESLLSLQDPIKMKQAAYKLIKKTIPPTTPPSMEKKKAELNAKKPVSVQAVSKNSAIGNASLFENGLTPETRKQLWAEMQAAIKQG
jgi:hypothetical protein